MIKENIRGVYIWQKSQSKNGKYLTSCGKSRAMFWPLIAFRTIDNIVM